MATKSKETYDVSSLTVLEGLDAVRKRPGMYIGSTDERGLQHCVWEIVDNAVDEALAGECTQINITFHPDDSVEICDNGRGIPTGIDPKTKLSGVELVMTKLHAGGKFGGGGYGVSGGLHGVGASVVNALSRRVDVTVKQNKKTHQVSFNRGIAGFFDGEENFTKGSLKEIGTAKAGEQGTCVRFWPDRRIFLEKATFNLQAALERARQTAFLVSGLELVVTDLRETDEKDQKTFAQYMQEDGSIRAEFKYEGGVADFVEFIAQDPKICEVLVLEGKETFTEEVPVLENDKLVSREVERNCEVSIALRWGTGYDTNVRTFVNIVATPKGGTHLAGFERALTKSVVEAARSTRAMKNNEESPQKEDILEGLSAVVLVRLAEPQFEGQTKEILGTSAVSPIVAKVVSEQMNAWFEQRKTKTESRKVIEKVVNASRARRAAKLHRETIRRKNALESSSLPAKLSDCRSNDMEVAELFIIEGDSAGGTVKAARDAEFQALLPIRGKILNTMRASEKQMLDNAECAAIITAMGAGSGKSFDLDAIRYGKLIILADADVDGAHIRCLLLTLAYRYMRPLLEAGRVYSAVPPLYRLETVGSKEYVYCYSDVERDREIQKIETSGKKLKDVQRFKGLGEMDAEQLAETTVEVEQRKLRRMTVHDGEAAALAFEVLMGQDVTARRNFIVENSQNIDLESIDA